MSVAGGENKETDEEKSERKRESALRDAMYALNQIQQLQIIDSEVTSDPKFQGIIGQIRSALDAIGTPEPEPETPAENLGEPSDEEMRGPMPEEKARGFAKRLGFGRDKMGMM